MMPDQGLLGFIISLCQLFCSYGCVLWCVCVDKCTFRSVIRDCNPGLDFSILVFGIGKIPILGSRDWHNLVWEYTTTAYRH